MSEVLTREEALQAAFEGKDLQFKVGGGRHWINSAVNGNKYELVRQVVISSTCDWRIKPDAFEEWWLKNCEGDYGKHCKELAKRVWNAAMGHKNNENI